MSGKTLGDGACGEVTLATNKINGTKRAIKTIQKANLSEENRKEFMNEVDVLKEMDHPNIIKIFEFYEDANSYHIVTEL